MFRCQHCGVNSQPRQRPVMMVTDVKQRVNATPFGDVIAKGLLIAKEERWCQLCADIFYLSITKGDRNGKVDSPQGQVSQASL